MARLAPHTIAVLSAVILALGGTRAEAAGWNGFYDGVQLGGSNVRSTAGEHGAGNSYGAFAGWYRTHRHLVTGVEADVDETHYRLDDGQDAVKRAARLKGRMGFVHGDLLVYATAGVIRADASGLGYGTGLLYGGGIDLPISKRFLGGIEVLHHDIPDFGSSGVGLSMTTVRVRLGMRF